jgi:glyoxylase-like metal-dependent hydrolase (beta-lactamase superfamily II)
LPWAQVTASARGAGQLQKPAVIEAIKNINRIVLANNGYVFEEKEYELEFFSIGVDDSPADGETRRLGDLTLEFIMVPGHSTCSMAVYVPEVKALFASDAGGIPFQGQVFAAANSNFDLYQASLEKLSAYEVIFHGAEHYGAVTGEDAKQFIGKSIQSAKETRKLIENSLAKTKNVPLTVQEVTDWMADNAGRYFLPKDVLKMVVDQMTGWLAKNMGMTS